MIATAMWVASFVGAGLFFLGGDRVGVWRERKRGKLAAPEGETDVVTVTEVQPKTLPSLSVPSGTQTSEAELQQLLQNVRAEAEGVAAQLASERAEAQRRRTELEGQIAQLQRSLKDATTRATTLEGELDRARKQLDGAVADKRQLQGELERRKLEILNLQTEKTSASQKIDDIQRQAATLVDPSQIEQLKYDLAVQQRVADAKAEELERVREENARLRMAASEAELLRQKNAELQAELGDTKLQVLLKPPKAPSLIPMVSGNRLQQALDSAAESARSASITDEQGLIIASRGEHAEEMGAFGAFLFSVAMRVQTHMPLGVVKHVSLEDANQLRLTVHRFHSADAQLVLSTLTLANEPDTEILRSLIDRINPAR